MAGLRGRKNYVQAAVDALNAGDLSAPIEPHGSAQQRKILRGLEKLRVSTLEQQIAHARAIEQNKLAIASVAHDVKTPLALISGYAECLQDGMDDKDYPALITEKTEQLNGLVLKLVETSKHEIEEIDSLKEKVNTRTFFGAVLDKYEQLAKTKNITYKVRRIPSAEIYADRRELERVFQNIVSNAVKYTDEGGKIEVSFERNGRFFVVKVKINPAGCNQPPPEAAARKFEHCVNNERSCYAKNRCTHKICNITGNCAQITNVDCCSFHFKGEFSD